METLPGSGELEPTTRGKFRSYMKMNFHIVDKKPTGMEVTDIYRVESNTVNS